MARMYARTGLSTNCALIKTGFKNLRTGTEAKFRPFVDALVKGVKRKITSLYRVIDLPSTSH